MTVREREKLSVWERVKLSVRENDSDGLLLVVISAVGEGPDFDVVASIVTEVVAVNV